MAKPLANEPGSAMHIHQSVIDAKTGRNIFTAENGEPTKAFYSFIHRRAADLCPARDVPVRPVRELIPPPSCPNGAAPINVEWGYDNRSAGLRIPFAPDAARRVENRLPAPTQIPILRSPQASPAATSG